MAKLIIQAETLNAIIQVMHDEADDDYEKLALQFTFDEQQGWAETDFAVTRSGVDVSKHLSPQGQDRVIDLAMVLFEDMRAHSGKVWKGFRIDYPSGSQAKTSFQYT